MKIPAVAEQCMHAICMFAEEMNLVKVFLTFYMML